MQYANNVFFCPHYWNCREQVIARTLSSWLEIARQKSSSHELTSIGTLSAFDVATYHDSKFFRTCSSSPLPRLVELTPDPSRLSQYWLSTFSLLIVDCLLLTVDCSLRDTEWTCQLLIIEDFCVSIWLFPSRRLCPDIPWTPESSLDCYRLIVVSRLLFNLSSSVFYVRLSRRSL